LCLVAAYRSNNFIVLLTNSYERGELRQLWQYTVCGQYPGHVAAGATVSLQCNNVCEGELRFRYVIVQFPLTDDFMNFCEIEVYAIGMYTIYALYFNSHVSC